MYPTKEEALKAGVPESDIAEIHGRMDEFAKVLRDTMYSCTIARLAWMAAAYRFTREDQYIEKLKETMTSWKRFNEKARTS